VLRKAPTLFSRRVDNRQAAGRKKYFPNLYHIIIKNIVPTPLSEIMVTKETLVTEKDIHTTHGLSPKW
jgi:hypothetical protein